MIMSIMAFNQMLPEDAQQTLVKNVMNKKQKSTGRSWWPFSRGTKDPVNVVGFLYNVLFLVCVLGLFSLTFGIHYTASSLLNN